MRITARLCVPLLLGLTSCATVTGTVAGPITGPITFHRHTYGIPGWVKVLLTPVTVAFGPLAGLATGAAADVGFARNLEYGHDACIPFEAVFDPANPDWGRPPQDPPHQSGS